VADLPLPWSHSPVPSDPVDRRDWLLAREEQIARLVSRRLRQIVLSTYDAWLGTLTASGDMAAFDAIPIAWESFVEDELLEVFGGLYSYGGLAVWLQAPGTAPLPASTAQAWVRIVNQQALEYQAQASNRLVGVGDNIWNGVRDLATRSVEQGLSTEELKGQIESYTKFSEFRADTIARTETSAAFVQGGYAGAEALGEYGPVAKIWSAVVDARTRPSHVDANGQEQAFKDPFDVGGTQMNAPHDDTAPAEEVVNCRCLVDWLFAGERSDLPPAPDYEQLVADEQARVQGLIDAGVFD